MAKYDTENLLRDIKALMVANLNTQIAAVEAEKIAGGFPTTGLAAVDTTLGYFEQSWWTKNLNVTPAIFYGIEDVGAVSPGPATVQNFKVFVEIILADSGLDAYGNLRINRYTRAIREVFENNWDQLGLGAYLKIETVRPISFKLEENSSEEIRVGGVSLSVSIA